MRIAATAILTIHGQKGKSARQALRKRIDYMTNPAKTNGGAYVSAFACAPETADAEFALSRREYRTLTGREYSNEVLAYHMRQSFAPGEITPEEANRMGCEFANRFLKGNHAYIVSTHMDKHHIHNHIIWNAISLNCTHKFHNFFWSSLAVRRLSDMICVEHGKSVIKQPERHGKAYVQWLGDSRKLSHRDLLRSAMDDALEKKPESFEALLALLEGDGYEIKRGKQLSFRKAGQKRFVRLDTLGEAYTKETLTAVIAGTRAHAPAKKHKDVRTEKPVSLLVDIEAKLQAGKGAGYVRWAKVFNAKQLAKTITYLSEHGFSNVDELRARADEASASVRDLLEQSRALDGQMKEAAEMRNQVIRYMRTKDVFAEYKRLGYPRAFLETHEAEIAMQREAKRYFNEHGMKKLPSSQALKAEIERLKAEKAQSYQAYRTARDEMRELLVVRENVERILREDTDKENPKEKTRTK